MITVVMFAPDTPGMYTNQAIVDPEQHDSRRRRARQPGVRQHRSSQNGGNGPFNDLQIQEDRHRPTSTPGGLIVYTLQVWNTGSDAASNVAVRDVLPAGETFVSAADAGFGPGGRVHVQRVGRRGRTARAPRSTAGGRRQRAHDHDQRDGAESGRAERLIPRRTAQRGGGRSGQPRSRKATSSTTRRGGHDGDAGHQPDDHQGRPDGATQSDVTDYTITVTNDDRSGGGQIATGVRVHDPLPVGLIPLAVDAGTGNNWAC